MKIDDYLQLLKAEYEIAYDQDLYITLTKLKNGNFQINASTFPRHYTEWQQFKMFLNRKNIRTFTIYAKPKTAEFDVLHIGHDCSKDVNANIDYLKIYEWNGKPPRATTPAEVALFLSKQKEVF